MKKKLLGLLMAVTMSMALIACGGGEEEATTKEVATEEAVVEEATEETEEMTDVEYTEEQQAFVDEYLQLCDDYDASTLLSWQCSAPFSFSSKPSGRIPTITS